MTTLTVWKFSTADGADKALAKLAELQKQELIEIDDAVIVSWPQGRKKPKTRQVADLVSTGLIDSAFWGMLFGFNGDFIKDVKAKVTEGTSALFLSSGKETLNKVEAAFAPEERGELIQFGEE